MIEKIWHLFDETLFQTIENNKVNNNNASTLCFDKHFTDSDRSSPLCSTKILINLESKTKQRDTNFENSLPKLINRLVHDSQYRELWFCFRNDWDYSFGATITEVNTGFVFRFNNMTTTDYSAAKTTPSDKKLGREQAFRSIVTFRNDSTLVEDEEPPAFNWYANLDFDDILPLLGGFGVYQVLLIVMLIPFLYIIAYVYFSQFFMTLVPKHWCKIDELMHMAQKERWVSVRINGRFASQNCY